ncbi:hypothetical protein J2T15_005967 [Paenibacillus harenae]|uniref:DUF3918 domain-containing protein n=1 Tax=Paenibacillus harenae TaxID=306543 RepID=A0ABT9UBV8_PAEHA|nr:hypothetical protein [Paenibacillus harenae]MDQ0116486.1 hypothetical protein [Paenibacillus harenae]
MNKTKSILGKMNNRKGIISLVALGVGAAAYGISRRRR